MTITITSIIILTFTVWILGKIFSIKMCPICGGVLLTWLWMLLGIYLGELLITDYQLPIAILAGGTIVGLMLKLETSIKMNFVLLWKTIFVISGFTAIYGLISFDWVIFSVSIFFAIIFTLVFKTQKLEEQKYKRDNSEELEEKLKNCC